MKPKKPKMTYRDMQEGGREAARYYGLNDRQVSQEIKHHMKGATQRQLQHAHEEFYRKK